MPRRSFVEDTVEILSSSSSSSSVSSAIEDGVGETVKKDDETDIEEVEEIDDGSNYDDEEVKVVRVRNRKSNKSETEEEDDDNYEEEDDENSNEEDDEEEDDEDSEADCRRSSRKSNSTLIHVNGYAVKKENNYVMKGMTYEYGVAVDDGKKKSAKGKRRKAAGKSKFGGGGVKKPRHVSDTERSRLAFKEALEERIREKASRRAAFLQEHTKALTPFVTPKVLEKIRSSHDPSSSQPNKEQSTVASAKTDKKNKVASVLGDVNMQPDLVRGEMRDYQLDGLRFMDNMYRHNVGCILGDEMGLGKTLQTISLVCHLKERYGLSGPSLIICPLSVLYSWCTEIEKWAPSLKHLRFHNSNSENQEMDIHKYDFLQYDIIVTTFEMTKVPTMKGLWQRQHFNLLVLDEGHRIKGIDTQISMAVRKIHSELRIILTGTPLANNLVELYSLLSFLVPDVFTTSTPFEEAFNLTLNIVDPIKLGEAHKLLSVFMVRRLKNQVEKLMPKKIETKVVCPLSNMQIWWYKALLLKDISILARDGTGPTKKSMLSNLIMQLRKACLHPFLFAGAEDDIDSTTTQDLIGASGKLAVLDKLLRSLFIKGHRVCLFSQFTSILDILEDYCDHRGWKFCRFDGGTARAKRNFVVNSFNAPESEKFIFLMSTRSGGLGLNLQSADTVILYDSDWNPQPDIQAMARVHRIGQKKTVHVYRLVTEGTVEARMVERAEKKLYLDRMVTRDGAETTLKEDEDVDVDKLMSTLRFGCNAVFGADAQELNTLPTDDDIEVITNRLRTEDFSCNKLKGGAEKNAVDFDACQQFTATTKFNGIDFKKIRDDYQQSQAKLKSIYDVTNAWKRQRKNRIEMVNGMGSGYGCAAVPVLSSNNYELQTGERSVLQQELGGDRANFSNPKTKRLKAGVDFQNLDYCQFCGDGGTLCLCPRCPVAVHRTCIGLKSNKQFLCCPHHSCAPCGKRASDAGGFLFTCASCPNSYCEDCVPKDARILESCEWMGKLGYTIKHGTYILCSLGCEKIAKQDQGWKPPKKSRRGDCPKEIDLASFFGGAVDETIEVPDEVSGKSKRKRESINYSVTALSGASRSKKNIDDLPDSASSSDSVVYVQVVSVESDSP